MKVFIGFVIGLWFSWVFVAKWQPEIITARLEPDRLIVIYSSNPLNVFYMNKLELKIDNMEGFLKGAINSLEEFYTQMLSAQPGAINNILKGGGE
jgi:hypothetical protein